MTALRRDPKHGVGGASEMPGLRSGLLWKCFGESEVD